MEITVEFDNKQVSQIFDCQIISDNLDNTIKFITNERLKLQPFLVKIGDEPIKVLCIQELEADGYLASRMKNIKRHKEILIWSERDNKILMRNTYIEGKGATIEQAIGFPLITIEMGESIGDSPYLWLRNGYLLHKDGTIETEGFYHL